MSAGSCALQFFRIYLPGRLHRIRPELRFPGLWCDIIERQTPVHGKEERMERRQFLSSAAAFAQAAQGPLPPASEKVFSGAGEVSYDVRITVERKRSGKPN